MSLGTWSREGRGLTRGPDALAIAGSLASVGVVVYGIFIGAIQIIGLGTAIAVVAGLARFWYDRDQDIRKRRIERVDRLLPVVYDPLFEWAVERSRWLSNHPIEDDYVYPRGPPDFGSKPVYSALVGDELQAQIEGIATSSMSYEDSFKKLCGEYHDRIRAYVKQRKPEWNYDGISLVLGSVRFGLLAVLVNYSFSQIIGNYREGAPVSLDLGSDTVACGPEARAMILRIDDLESYRTCVQARKDFHSGIDDLIKTLTRVVREGEEDWKL